MKKLVLFAVAALTISLVACGNKNAQEQSATQEPVANQEQNQVQNPTDSLVAPADSLAKKAEEAAN